MKVRTAKTKQISDVVNFHRTNFFALISGYTPHQKGDSINETDELLKCSFLF
jgi:hypothetical protein